jgi:hypothetical protein
MTCPVTTISEQMLTTSVSMFSCLSRGCGLNFLPGLCRVAGDLPLSWDPPAVHPPYLLSGLSRYKRFYEAEPPSLTLPG